MEGKHPGYYEAILQLRHPTELVLDFVYAEIERKGIYITKEEEEKNGIDIYLADGPFTRDLGHRLQAKFGGEYLVTAKLYGNKDGRDVYRLTVLFRQAHFAKHDLITYRGNTYIVKTLDKEIILQEEKTGKKIRLKYKEMSAIKKVEA